MRKLPQYIGATVVGVLLMAAPAFAANKEMVQLQTQVQALQDQLQHLQQSNDERFGAMRGLLEQNTDTINRVANSLDAITHSLQGQSADQGGKIDQVSGQVQALHDSVDELKARMAKVSKQLDDMAAVQQNLQAAPPNGAQPGQPGQTTGPQGQPQAQAPPPDVLYNNAISDYNGAKYNLATQEFGDYVKYYGNTDLAGNAQYYIADIEYRQGNYQQAVQDYDKVLEQYPSGNKAAAAQLKKGYALLQLNQRDAATKELRSLIARYPRSLEAQQARDRLRSLGANTSASKPSPSRR
jgi:tol-pal system protein YbgF